MSYYVVEGIIEKNSDVQFFDEAYPDTWNNLIDKATPYFVRKLWVNVNPNKRIWRSYFNSPYDYDLYVDASGRWEEFQLRVQHDIDNNIIFSDINRQYVEEIDTTDAVIII